MISVYMMKTRIRESFKNLTEEFGGRIERTKHRGLRKKYLSLLGQWQINKSSCALYIEESYRLECARQMYIKRIRKKMITL